MCTEHDSVTMLWKPQITQIHVTIYCTSTYPYRTVWLWLGFDDIWCL